MRSALEELASGEVPMTIHEFNDVLSTLGRQRKMRAAMGLIRVSQTSAFGRVIGPQRTVKTYTIMLDIFGKSQQLDQAFALFYEMQRDGGTPPSQVTYNALISSCSRNNEPELAHEVFKDMQEAGLDGDKFTYASLIDAHAKRGDVERAFEISRLMDEKGVRKDQTIYSALMEACSRVKQLPRALTVFEEMKSEGVWPNLITFAVLLDCCANAREPYKAFELFGEIKYWGLTSNVVTWTGLLHACSKAGWPERAEMVLEHMRAAGVEPNEITFGALVDAWTRSGRMDRAFEAIERMAQVDGVAPNAVLIGGLVEACRRLRDGEYVGRVWALVMDHNIRPARTYYPTLLSLAALSGDTDTAVSIAAHCYARGMLRRVMFGSRDPTLQALAYALVCVSKACEVREDGEAQLERLRPIFESISTGDDPAVATMPFDEAFERATLPWEGGFANGGAACGGKWDAGSGVAKARMARRNLGAARARLKDGLKSRDSFNSVPANNGSGGRET
jgi:pentatricopeptide repeat protein